MVQIELLWSTKWTSGSLSTTPGSSMLPLIHCMLLKEQWLLFNVFSMGRTKLYRSARIRGSHVAGHMKTAYSISVVSSRLTVTFFWTWVFAKQCYRCTKTRNKWNKTMRQRRDKPVTVLVSVKETKHYFFDNGYLFNYVFDVYFSVMFIIFNWMPKTRLTHIIFNIFINILFHYFYKNTIFIFFGSLCTKPRLVEWGVYSIPFTILLKKHVFRKSYDSWTKIKDYCIIASKII